MINKDELLQRVMEFSETAYEYEEIGVLLIKRCQKLYLKINSTDPQNYKKLIKMKFEIDELDLALKQHKLKISDAHGKLVSNYAFNVAYYGFIMLVLIYSFLYIVVASVDPSVSGNTESSLLDRNMIVYMKYLILSVMGVMFYYVTNYLIKFGEIQTRLFVACFIPVLLTGVVFTLENGNLSFSGSQSLVFLLGYNTNLVISILRIGNDKIKASIEGKKTEGA
ncbi:hypothetical protein DET54_12123 [Paenibacillus pabuli]|uniref:Uncharacterized protein n=1 Tax=Paenibacillus pabuli TaxID=1472 RepID=A0ABX9BC81_9BACL|nr:hypothetical protein [Paenibacillus pabuli]RAI85668.1 hypothetical protein DET54_12123 [Paenibacillus pabuli]